MRLNKSRFTLYENYRIMHAFMSATRPSLKNRAVEPPNLGTNNERNKTVKYGSEIVVVFVPVIVVTN